MDEVSRVRTYIDFELGVRSANNIHVKLCVELQSSFNDGVFNLKQSSGSTRYATDEWYILKRMSNIILSNLNLYTKVTCSQRRWWVT